jgi:hypothetical protein
VEVVLEELGLKLMEMLVLTHNLHQLFLLAVGLEAEVGHQQITVETVVLEVGVRWLLVPVEQVTHHFAHLLKEITEAAALIAELSMAGVAVVVLEELGLMEAVLGLSGDGGAGVSNDISGSPLDYAGGGGGGAYSVGPAGTGGSGGRRRWRRKVPMVQTAPMVVAAVEAELVPVRLLARAATAALA